MRRRFSDSNKRLRLSNRCECSNNSKCNSISSSITNNIIRMSIIARMRRRSLTMGSMRLAAWMMGRTMMGKMRSTWLRLRRWTRMMMKKKIWSMRMTLMSWTMGTLPRHRCPQVTSSTRYRQATRPPDPRCKRL